MTVPDPLSMHRPMTNDGPERTEARRAADRLIALVSRARDLELERAPVGSDAAIRAPTIDLCTAVLTMRIAAELDPGGTAGEPMHVAVFGGTNTGKSTALNVLLGRAACGMQVTARFSQFPEAWRDPSLDDRWRSAHPSRFAAYELHQGERVPRRADDELARGWRPALAVLDPEHHGGPRLADPSTRRAVLWDAPDVSTEEAQSWLGGVLDLAALCDVLIFVCTDESYADDRALGLLRLIASTGAQVEVCANKVGAGGGLYDDVKRKLRGDGDEDAAIVPDDDAFHRLPLVAGEDPSARLGRLLATPEAGELRARVGRLEHDVGRLRARALAGSLDFLERSLDRALEPLRAEARVAERWAAVVRRATRQELEVAYAESYLDSQRYEEFRAALTELTRLLELPGVGPLLSGLGRVARTPLVLAKKAWTRMVAGAAGGDRDQPAEERVVARLFKAWLEALRAEAQTLARADAHPAWEELANRLDEPAFQEELVTGFQAGYRRYRDELRANVSAAAERIHTRVRENPKLLAGLRAANLVGDAGVTISAVAAGGLSPTDLILGPLVHGLWTELVERGLGSYITAQEARLKKEQRSAMTDLFGRELAVPARALFVGAFDPEELDRARSDLASVSAALRAETDGEGR